MSSSHPLEPMFEKLASQASLSYADQAAIHAIPHQLATADGGTYLVRQGDKTETCCVVLTGFAYRSRTTGNGGRQILAFHMRGEVVDLQNSVIPIADHSVQTLTRADLAFIPQKAIIEVAAHFPAIGRALSRQTLVEASIAREWMVSLGRRTARQRVSHLICELASLQKAASMTGGPDFAWPVTQEQVADATGLTAVHVNRTMRDLRSDGIISIDRHVLTIGDWDALRREGDFRAAYLHQPDRAYAA